MDSLRTTSVTGTANGLTNKDHECDRTVNGLTKDHECDRTVNGLTKDHECDMTVNGL